MNRRNFLKKTRLGAAALAVISSTECTRKQDRPYNLLFIAIDDMNNSVGAWGGQAITPNIDRLASQGVKFTRAHCVVPACNPSRAALFTGQRPETTGQFGNAGNFRDKPGGKDRVTLPQYLRKHGYKAVGAGKLFHHPRGAGDTPNSLSDDISWDAQWVGNIGTTGSHLYQDADGWAMWLEGSHMQYITPGKSGGMNYMCSAGIWGPIPQTTEETGDWKMSDFCAQFLQKAHDAPFFLGCGIFRPHSPQLAPQQYFDMYPLDEIDLPEVPEDDMNDIPDIAKENFSTPFVRLMREKGQWKKAVQGYLACMTYADDCVGHVIQSLENSPHANNTVVVLWTDHGFQLGHKNRYEKFTLWDQSTNAPLIFRYPGMRNRGAECRRAVSFLDIYPTTLDLLGLSQPAFLDGQSLRPLLEKPSREWPYPAVVTYPEGSCSVKYEQWNYIQYHDYSEELYDHSVDPGEFNNLAGDPAYAEIKAKLCKHIPYDTLPEHVQDDSKEAWQRK